MKKLFLLLIGSIGLVSLYACEPPTGHCVINVAPALRIDMVQYVNHEINAKDPFGGFITVGYETPKRWSTFVAKYVGLGSNEHSLGGEYQFNCVPFWICSPITVHIPVGIGYQWNTLNIASNQHDSWYCNTGLEIDFGGLTNPIQFFIRDDIGFYSDVHHFNPVLNNYLYAGLKIWIGKAW